jgi:hypothetical protein
MNLFGFKKKTDIVPEEVEQHTQMQGAIQTPKYINEAEIDKATTTLREYMKGKANLDARIIEDEQWYKGQHWAAIRKKMSGNTVEPTSRWLFNTIMNKHSDLMDNIPQAVALPRELSDVEAAKTLSSVLPVVLEYNGFEQTYADNAWELLKHGTAAYGVFWDAHKDVIGDISIKAIDLLRIYWEPGITDIQKSRNLFILDLVDTDLLEQRYPDKKGQFKGNAVTPLHYEYNDEADVSKKSVVIDWYYKKATQDGREVLHFCKFAGKAVLFSSEDDPSYADGFYAHGKYPVVLDTLFPEKGTPAGFGEVALCKDPQLYIDKLMGNILETSMLNTKRRFFAKKSANINRDQLKDNNEVLIEVDGDIDDTRIREFTARDISPIYANIVQMKIEEMKETSANRDVNSGGTGSGVTAASAIAALQEAGNKSSRDIISSSYRRFVEVVHLVIELMRQFYDVQRTFRITNQTTEGSYEFVSFSNAGIKPQPSGMSGDGETLYRKPIFDISIKAQKKNPFSIMSQNELAKELLNMGAFNPERAQEIQGALMMMEFEGKEQVEEYVKQGQTLLNIVQQMSQEMMMLKAAIGIPPQNASMGGGTQSPSGVATPSPITDGIMQAQGERTPYMEALAKRSVPTV